MDLKEFRAEIEKLMENDYIRPFICEGSPLDCKIFLVGINPAARMGKSFWTFWSDSTGMKREAWLNDYLEQRKKEAKKQQLGVTRRNINLIFNKINSIVKCLETNIYTTVTDNVKQLKKNKQALDTSIFEFLLKTIQPSVIYIHGDDVIKYFEKEIEEDIVIEKDKITRATFKGVKIKIYATNHLSRGFGKIKVDCIADKLVSMHI
ncbi:MAG: uracil-DNA glycosylase family protein [Candidatus Thermoplasmatota archaeon]